MSLQIDIKYVHLISPRFEKFQRKHDYLFACRCPLCGDSNKNKSKMRGYIYRKGNDLFYKCHNCGVGVSIGNLIKQLDVGLYKEYIMDRYKSGEMGNANYQKPKFVIPAPRFGQLESETYQNAERCDKLPEQHFCIQYLKSRRIPIEMYSKLYYTDNYKKFVDEVYPEHGKDNLTEDKRLVIPFYDKYNALIAVSGRALERSEYKLRYVTIRTNTDESKLIYGLDRVDFSKTVYVVEGPIDSMFLPNAIAAGDANLALVAKSISAAKIILIPDREPRNKDIVKNIYKCIREGFNVCLLPDTLEGKDINEYVIDGLSGKKLVDMIEKHTFSGVRAEMEFSVWKRIDIR